MAQAFRMGSNALWMRAAFGFPAGERYAYLVLIGSAKFSLGDARPVNNLLELPNSTFEFERMLMKVGADTPRLASIDCETGDSQVEELTFHPSVFTPFFDFVRNERSSPSLRAPISLRNDWRCLPTPTTTGKV